MDAGAIGQDGRDGGIRHRLRHETLTLKKNYLLRDSKVKLH